MESIVSLAEKSVRDLFEQAFFESQESIDEWIQLTFNTILYDINNNIVPVENYIDLVNYVANYHRENYGSVFPTFPINIKHTYNCFLLIIALCRYSNFFENNYSILDDPQTYILD